MSADAMIKAKLREGTVTPLRARPAARSAPPAAPGQKPSSSSTHAIMLAHGFLSYGAPRDGTPGALYGVAHPSRDGRKLLVHTRTDGDWTTWQTSKPDGSDAAIHAQGNGHQELATHVRKWKAG